MEQREYEGVGQDMWISLQIFLEDVSKRKYMYSGSEVNFLIRAPAGDQV